MEVIVFTINLDTKHFLFLQGIDQKVEKKGKVAHKLPIYKFFKGVKRK